MIEFLTKIIVFRQGAFVKAEPSISIVFKHGIISLKQHRGHIEKSRRQIYLLQRYKGLNKQQSIICLFVRFKVYTFRKATLIEI